MAGHVVAVGASLASVLGPGSSECRSSRRRRLLDRARVVVLMPGQGSTSRERLLAIGVGAFVGALARVCPPVPSQRAAVTKRLQDDKLAFLLGGNMHGREKSRKARH